MRQFIVLGFSSNSKTDSGKSLYLGGDRGEAIGVVNEPESGFVRKAMYELALPHIARHFDGDEQPAPDLEPNQDDQDDQNDQESGEQSTPADDDQDDQPDDQDEEQSAPDDDQDDQEPGDQDQDRPEMTDSALELAIENDLTDEQIAEIKPSGSTGKILKDDVQDYIESLGTE